MNLGDFRVSVSTEIGLDNSVTAAPWSAEQTLIDGYVNRGVVDLLRKTRCNIDIDPMILTAGDGDYNISQAVMEIVELDLLPASGGLYPRPQRVGLAEILNRRKLMPMAAVAPQIYSFSGSNLISFYPVPSGSDTAMLYYVPRPQPLVNLTDHPDDPNYGGIPVEFHDAIEYYAQWRAASYDDSADAVNYYKMYQSRFREIRREVGRTGGQTMPRMRIHSRVGRHSKNFGFMPGIDAYGYS